MSDLNVEKMLRDQYAGDTRRASYYWSIERNGLVVVEEYDSLGNLHKLSEIPPPPFIFHARAYRVTDMPHYTIAIEPGMGYIWTHRVRESLDMHQLEGEAPSTYLEEDVIFGRKLPDGREELKLIYADGMAFEFVSAPPAPTGTHVTMLTPRGATFERHIPMVSDAALWAALSHHRL